MSSGRGSGRHFRRSAEAAAAARASRKWVRPTAQSSLAATSDVVRDENGTAVEEATSHGREREHRPLLKGPRRHAWKRPGVANTSRSDRTRRGKDLSSNEPLGESGPAFAETRVDGSADLRHQAADTNRAAGPIDNTETNERVSSTKSSTSHMNDKLTAPDDEMQTRSRHGDANSAMEKRGTNKLVLAIKPPEKENPIRIPAATSLQATSAVMKEAVSRIEGSLLRRRGPHKLVSSQSAKTAPRSSSTAAGVVIATSIPTTGPCVASSRGRRRLRTHTSMQQQPKRIRLETAKSYSNTTQEIEPDRDEPDIRSVGVEMTAPQHQPRPDEGAKLTEFAYRATSAAVSSRGRGRGRGRGRTNNMGLVRLEPNEETTPICPTFARGIACENVNCTKRHDVPKEATMPFCSFFQKQGQCLKGGYCPFRHIKINPRALTCPSFTLLGFCTEEGCLMKHERAPSTNKTIRGGGEKKSGG